MRQTPPGMQGHATTLQVERLAEHEGAGPTAVCQGCRLKGATAWPGKAGGPGQAAGWTESGSQASLSPASLSYALPLHALKLPSLSCHDDICLF